MKFFREIHKETSEGKYSSKKIWGSVIMTLVCIAFVTDGFHFYQTDHVLFNSMLVAGTALIGLNTIGGIFKKEPPSTKPTETK